MNAYILKTNRDWTSFSYRNDKILTIAVFSYSIDSKSMSYRVEEAEQYFPIRTNPTSSKLEDYNDN